MAANPLLRRARRRTRGGFSLLELTAVIVVLLAITAVSIPTYDAWRNRAWDRAAEEILRNVSSRAQSHVAASGTDRFDTEVLSATVKRLPADANAAGPGVGAAVTFSVVEGASNAYGEISVGIDEDGARHGLAMVSQSGNCVTSLAELRGTVTTQVHGPLGDACRGGAAGTAPTFEPPGPPDAPDLCAASAGGCDEGDRRVVLRWAPPEADDVDGYDILRQPGACPPSGPGELLATVDAGTTTYVDDDGLTNGEPYCYWVIATDRAGNRSQPDRETLTPTDDVAPTSPMNLVATGLPLAVRLEWEAATDDFLAGYRILRSTEHPDLGAVNSDGEPGPEADTYELVATIGPATTYVDDLSGATLPGGREVWEVNFWYRVEAYDTSDNVSGPSNPAGAQPTLGTHAGIVTATAVGGVQRATITWTPAARPAALAGYRVYRDGTLIAEPEPGELTYTDTGLADGTTYTYEVTTYSSGGVESPPGEAEATTVAVPSGLATAPGSSQITITWAASTGAERYHVDVDGTGAPFADTADTSAVHDGLGNSETHEYRVRGCAEYETLTCTGWSAPVSGITLPGAAVLTATSGQPNHVPLSWVDPAGVGQESWQLQYKTAVGNGSWLDIDTAIPGGTRTYHHTEAQGAADGWPWAYRVRAKGPTGLWGPWSNEVTASSMAKPNPPTFSSTAGPGTIQCPRGWFATNAPAWVSLPTNYPENHCVTRVNNNGGPGTVTISGYISAPNQRFDFNGAGVWQANSVAAAHGTNWLDAVYAVAEACNQAGCVASSTHSLSAPKPTSPALTKTTCVFFHCEVRAVSFFAQSMEFETSGGLYGNGMVFQCNNCYMHRSGFWSWATSAPRTTNGPVTFQASPRTYDEPCNRVVCVLRVAAPMGTSVRVAGTSFADAFAPDHWCKWGTGAGGRPLEATCQFSSIRL